MLLRLFACGLLIVSAALTLGCDSHGKPQPPDDKVANSDKLINSDKLTNSDKLANSDKLTNSSKLSNSDNKKPENKGSPDKDVNDKTPAGKDPKVKVEGELKLLQGTWTCVLRTIGEKELFASQGKRTLEIKGDVYEEGTLVLDAKAKPKRLDVKLTAGDEKGKTMKGIYKFSEDKLVWCFNNDVNGPRPETFDPAKHSESMEVCIFTKGTVPDDVK